MNLRPWILAALAVSALGFGGCGQNAPDEAGHAHDEHAEHDESGATFEEGRGLLLAPEVAAVLSVRTAGAETRPFAAEHRITAQVFATTPQFLAVARLTPALAGTLADATPENATLVSIDRSAETATHLVDAVFALRTSNASAPGDFVSLTLRAPPTPMLVVPHSSLLDSAAGTFVYVVTDGSYRRTPVTRGAQTAGFVAITAGLRAGDVVVTAPVEQLWLTELRLTKGGGHSH